MPTHTLNLSALPSEILLTILSHLDVHDLHQLSLASRPLRRLACDPTLHLQRLHAVPPNLTHALSRRPPRNALSPPNASILLSRMHVLRRRISLSLVRIGISHLLSRRPAAHELVRRGVLPASYSVLLSPQLIPTSLKIQRQRLKNTVARKLQRRPSVADLVERHILPEECGRRPGAVSPLLVETRRKVMRERLKDGLRRWVEGRAVVAQRERSDLLDAAAAAATGAEESRVSVRALVRRLQARRDRAARDEQQQPQPLKSELVQGEQKRKRQAWGAEAEKERERARNQPTRAHVLGLKRFWEGISVAAAG